MVGPITAARTLGAAVQFWVGETPDGTICRRDPPAMRTPFPFCVENPPLPLTLVATMFACAPRELAFWTLQALRGTILVGIQARRALNARVVAVC